MLACTNGNAKVRETIYPDRFKHIPELRRMGINAIVVGDEVVVEGGGEIQGAQVMSTDLRASVSLVLYHADMREPVQSYDDMLRRYKDVEEIAKS